MLQTLDQHIDRTTDVVGGQPRIAGRRITVQNIVIWHEWMHKSAEEIAAEYDVTVADVYAALAYYYDHRAEIDGRIKQDAEFIEALRQRTASPILQKLHGRAN